MQQENTTLPPSYRELLIEAGKQLILRKDILLKRILLILWPFLSLIIFVVIVSLLKEK